MDFKKQPLLILLFALVLCQCKNDPPISTQKNDPSDYAPTSNKWGFIDKKGHLIISAEYDDIRAFSEGLALVRKGDLWGFINAQNKVIIPFQYKAAWSFHNGLARVQNQDRGIIFIHKNGKELPSKWDEAGDMAEGFAWVRKSTKYGFINQKGTLAIDTIFDKVSNFHQQKAIAKKGKYYGIINTSGDWIIPPSYQKTSRFNNGLVRVKKEGKWGYINSKNEWLIKPQFFSAEDFQHGKAAVATENGYVLIDKEGRPSSPYYSFMQYGNAQRWIVEKDGLFGLIDNNGIEVIPCNLEQIYHFVEGVAPFQLQQLWGMMDTMGKILITPQFGLAWDFNDQIARVFTEDGIAFINKQGAIVIPAKYLDVRDFSEDLAGVQFLKK